MRRSLDQRSSTCSPRLTRMVSAGRPAASASSNTLAGCAAAAANTTDRNRHRSSLLGIQSERPGAARPFAAFSLVRSLALVHLDVAAGECPALRVATAGGAGDMDEVGAARLAAFAVVLHAHAEAGRSAVVGAAAVELHRIGA